MPAGWEARLQLAAAAALAWLIANKARRHAAPFFAPVAAIMSLSANLGQALPPGHGFRVRRVG